MQLEKMHHVFDIVAVFLFTVSPVNMCKVAAVRPAIVAAPPCL